MADLPSGTVTFLFTDVEGSTRLLQELGDEYATVLAEHRQVLREAFARHGGVEVDTQGDAFFVSFATASAALAAAAEARDALGDGPLRVRMGLHTGDPLMTDEGYVGLDVHRAARIAAAGHGGQILLSERTAALVNGAFELQDLGLHRLKDLVQPEKLFQLGEAQFPPLRSLNATNLPAQPNTLIGRTRELGEVVPLVGERRIVTLFGPGGTGKTRLALQVAAELVDDFKDGVFWVPLAPLSDPSLLESTAAQLLGAKDRLAEQIAEKRLLLLLDNLEQLLPAAAVPIAELAAECPNLHLLVTSRTVLRVRGESVYPVEPLPDQDAVRLFADRASSVDPEEAVYEICRRLDGLPLAIELAAARTWLMPPDALLMRLSKALPLLTGGARDSAARQQTLGATIAWSYDLLVPDDQVLFRRLAAFAGSASLEAAEAVGVATLDALESLVDQSLLRRWQSGRLGMLETIREFALEQLDASPEAEAVHLHHAQYFLDLVERAEPELRGGHWGMWLDQLEVEHPNIQAAIDWAEHSGRRELSLRLIVAMRHFWFSRGYLEEGSRRFDEVLTQPDLDPDVRVAALGAAAVFACERGDFDRAKPLLEERLELARGIGDELRVVDSLRILGTTHGELGDLGTARRLLEESVRRAHAFKDDTVAMLPTADLGYLHMSEGDYETAIQLYEEVVSLAMTHADGHAASVALENIGIAELRLGRPHEAVVRLRDALGRAYDARNPSGVINALVVLAAAAAEQARAGRSALLLGAADALRDAVGYSLQHHERSLFEEAVVSSSAVLGEQTFSRDFAEGQQLDMDAAVSYAMSETE